MSFLPSRINKIFYIKGYIDNKHNTDYTLENLYVFFKNQPKIFMELVNKVFKGERVNRDLLINFFMEKIRQDFVNGINFRETLKKALLNLEFFGKLNLIDKNQKEVFYMEDRFNDIYEKYSMGLDSPVKKAVFLLGSLTQMLINVQYFKRGQAPFLKNLKGLKMDVDDVKALLAKVVNKLIEYDSFDAGKRDIAQEVSRNFMKASQQDYKLSVDELNFYFVTGMTLSEEVANLVYNNKQQKEENKDG